MTRTWAAAAGAILIIAVVIAYGVGRAGAYGIPQTGTLAYSGTLLTFGQPDNNAHLIGLTLYLSSGTQTSCVIAAANTQVVNGQFTVPLPESCVTVIHANPGLDAQVTIDGTAMGMQPLTAVPYAVEADTASNAAPGSALSFVSQIITDTSGGTTCSGLAGHVRYTGTDFQGCEGTNWASLTQNATAYVYSETTYSTTTRNTYVSPTPPSGVSPFQVTVPQAGTYFVTASARAFCLQGTTDAWWKARLYDSTTGTVLGQALGLGTVAGYGACIADTTVPITTIATFNAGDVLTLQFVITGSGTAAVDLIGDGNGGSSIALVRVSGP